MCVSSVYTNIFKVFTLFKKDTKALFTLQGKSEFVHKSDF